MPKSEARRQKKLMRKKRKDKVRKKKQRETSLESYASAKRAIRNARNNPIYECLINAYWRDEGLARILVSRLQPNNNILFGFYLVDIFCLGLKDTYCNANFSLARYENEMKGRILQQEKMINCPVDLAHQIIYGAIEYANNLGFKPHKDFDLSKYVLQLLSEFDGTVDVEFGRDGKPFFVSGPYDNAEMIIKQLSAKLGDGNFDYLIEAKEEDLVTLNEDDIDWINE